MHRSAVNALRLPTTRVARLLPSSPASALLLRLSRGPGSVAPHVVGPLSTYSSSTRQNMAAGRNGPVVGGKATPASAVVEEESEEDASMKGKLKLMWKRYGMVAIGTYLGIYVSVLSSVFFALDYDIFRAATFGLDPVAAVKKVCDLVESTTGNTSLPGYIRENPRVGTFAVAWVFTKFTEPLRLLVAVSVTPSVSRLLKYSPPKEKAN